MTAPRLRRTRSGFSFRPEHSEHQAISGGPAPATNSEPLHAVNVAAAFLSEKYCFVPFGYSVTNRPSISHVTLAYIHSMPLESDLIPGLRSIDVTRKAAVKRVLARRRITQASIWFSQG